MGHKLLIVVNLLVLMSQIPVRVNGVTLNPALLASKGYTTSSTYVFLIFANIDSIDPNAFNGYDHLNHLTINWNSLPNIDFSRLGPLRESLEALDLSNNPIAELRNEEDVNFPLVWDLMLLDIQISVLDMHLIKRTFPNLQNLVLSSQKLEKLLPHQLDEYSDSEFSQLLITVKKQKDLSASHFSGVANTIRLISFKSSDILSVEENTFAELSKLDILDLSNNSLKFSETFVIPSSLWTLVLRDNYLTPFKLIFSFLDKPVSLAFLDLSGNKFSHFSFIDFNALPELRHLYLSKNPLDYPNKIFEEIKYAVHLEYLYLVQLGITGVPSNAFETMGKLNTIDLSYNPISEIGEEAFLSLDDLYAVYITNTKVTHIGKLFSGRTKLYSIYMPNNQIYYLNPSAFAGLESLGKVDLSYNELTSINKSMFADSLKLKYVYLHRNKISYIEPGTFSNFPELDTVFLTSNQLTNLDVNMFAGCNKLRSIYLGGNSIPASISQQLCPTPLCTVYNY